MTAGISPLPPRTGTPYPVNRRTFLRQTGAACVAGVWSTLDPQSARGGGAGSKTILLHSAWQTINIGDIGHTPGTLRIIEQHLPDAQVILWAASLNAPVEAMLRRRFPKVEIVQGSLAKDVRAAASL